MSADGKRSGQDHGPDGTSSLDKGAPLAAMAQLRERVTRAVTEIERLRGENEHLARRVEELAARQPASPDGSGSQVAFDFGGDASEVKEKVQGFIDALDRALAVHQNPNPSSSPESA